MHDPQPGQLWEADNRLFYILELVVRDMMCPARDVYRCIEFYNPNMMFEGHLTIRRQDTFNSPTESGLPFHAIWKRLV